MLKSNHNYENRKDRKIRKINRSASLRKLKFSVIFIVKYAVMFWNS